MPGSSSQISGSNRTKKSGLSRLFSLASFSKHSSTTFSRKKYDRIGLGTGELVKTGLLSPSSFQNTIQERKEASVDGSKSQDVLECPICLQELPLQNFPELRSCSHRTCFQCLQQYLRIEITESRVINVPCPECTKPLHPSDIYTIVNDEILCGKYEAFMLRRLLMTEPETRWCPAPDCGYAVTANDCAGCPKIKCERPGCSTFFCYNCREEWHPNVTCSAARIQRAHLSTGNSSLLNDDIKSCPRCKVLTMKLDDGSCNRVVCSVCKTSFCWLCMKEISELHFFSSSGCTFFGKKPWSRKKKILWQIGMLIGGAPVSIALFAGLAVPAIIVGIPFLVGRKLYAKYSSESMSRSKRNIMVAVGVLGSVLASPILAGIAVGVGVPVSLLYVYGLIPFALLMNGNSRSASDNNSNSDQRSGLSAGAVKKQKKSTVNYALF